MTTCRPPQCPTADREDQVNGTATEATDNSRAHGIFDGHHDHELHGLQPVLNKEIPRRIARGFFLIENGMKLSAEVVVHDGLGIDTEAVEH